MAFTRNVLERFCSSVCAVAIFHYTIPYSLTRALIASTRNRSRSFTWFSCCFNISICCSYATAWRFISFFCLFSNADMMNTPLSHLAPAWQSALVGVWSAPAEHSLGSSNDWFAAHSPTSISNLFVTCFWTTNCCICCACLVSDCFNLVCCFNINILSNLFLKSFDLVGAGYAGILFLFQMNLQLLIAHVQSISDWFDRKYSWIWFSRLRISSW